MPKVPTSDFDPMCLTAAEIGTWHYVRNGRSGNLVARIQEISSIMGKDVETRQAKLETAARMQVALLAVSAALFIVEEKEDSGISDEEVTAIIQQSLIGRLIGKLDDGDAYEFLNLISQNPGDFFEWQESHGVPQPQLTFKESVRGSLRSLANPNVGCSAINLTVECPYSGDKVNVFDEYWQALVPQVLAEAFANELEEVPV